MPIAWLHGDHTLSTHSAVPLCEPVPPTVGVCDDLTYPVDHSLIVQLDAFALECEATIEVDDLIHVGRLRGSD